MGIHYSKTLEKDENAVKGKEFVEQTRVYRNPLLEGTAPRIYLQKITDVKCYIKRTQGSHYLFKGLPKEFVVDAKNKWDPHPVQSSKTSYSIVKRSYETLAESDRGPLIVTHENTCCVQFQLSRKYRETVKILSNFIARTVQEITFKQRKVHRTLAETISKRLMTMHINPDHRVHMFDQGKLSVNVSLA